MTMIRFLITFVVLVACNFAPILALAPTGCSYSNGSAACSFASWAPPLYDANFTSGPGNVVLSDINGVIPSDAFIGLDYTSGSYSGTPQLNLECGFNQGHTMTLLTDSLTSNLAWVQNMLIADCNDMELNDGAFSALTGLTLLNFLDGNISSISPTAFAGMTSLQTLYIYASMPTTGIPAGLFAGLTALQHLDMSKTLIYSIPAGLFDDLKNLLSLNMEDCGLTTLPADVFRPLFSISTLVVDQNAWTCDCDLAWFGEYITDTGLSNSTCASPAGLAGYDLSRAVSTLACTVDSSVEDDSMPSWYTYALIGANVTCLALASVAIGLYVALKSKTSALISKAGNQMSNSGVGNQTMAKNPGTSGIGNGSASANGNLTNGNAWQAQTNEIPRTNGSKTSGKVSPSDVRVSRTNPPTRREVASW